MDIVFSLILIITLICLGIICIYNEKNFKLYQNFIIKNGHEVKAEVLGYVKKYRYGDRTLKKSYAYNYIVLKFKDIEGKDHIIVDRSKSHFTFKFKKGDIILIKYLEANKINSQNIHNFNSITIDNYQNNDIVKIYNVHTKQVETLNKTDIDKDFCVVILDKSTVKSKFKLILFMYLIIIVSIIYLSIY